MTTGGGTSGPEDLLRLAETSLPAALAERLPALRWFGDKQRDIAGVELVEMVAATEGERAVGLALARVAFADGGSAEYALPLALVPGEQEGAFAVQGGWSLVDGSLDPAFADWWLRSLADGATFRGHAGILRFEPMHGLAAVAPAALAAGGRLLAAEQSNSAIRYGAHALAKVFRRIQPGVNPDVEIGLRLWEATGFQRLPEPLGVVSWERGGDRTTVGFVQAWVDNEGDGWSWLLATLDRWLAGGAASVPNRREALADLRSLGRRTGEMHAALASCGDDPAFRPRPLDDAACAAFEAQALANLDRTLDELRGAGALPDHARRMADEVVSRRDRLRRRLGGMADLAGTYAIRVHGDYHLGQVLRTVDGDWTILDFEGEPARPIEERREKLPALKDVGGMLRSFAYARGAALAAVAARGAALPEDALSTWERDARGAFLEGYRAAAREAALPIVPAGDAAFARALDAWELDKALYEVRYELANRPGWVALPLRALAS